MVAIYAVGILSCNLAVTVSVVVAPTSNVGKLYVKKFPTGVIVGAGHAVCVTESKSSQIAHKSSCPDIV